MTMMNSDQAYFRFASKLNQVCSIKPTFSSCDWPAMGSKERRTHFTHSAVPGTAAARGGHRGRSVDARDQLSMASEMENGATPELHEMPAQMQQNKSAGTAMLCVVC